MMIPRNIGLLAAMLTAAILVGCYQRVEVASTPCDALGKITDRAVKAELEKRCGRGGPDFKPTPPKTY